MTTEQLLRQLADPRCYPGAPGAVTLHQTHLSVVCVAGEFAYKLKKPVRLPFVDFSTLERRKHFAEEELRLNLRLCPEVYLDVVPLFATAGGVSFRERASAEIIEYAVLMRRLPAGRMMDVLLAEDAVAASDVEGIAQTMAAFHRRVALPGDHPDAAPSAARLRELATANFDETGPQLETVFDPGLHRLLGDVARRDFDRWLPSLVARARAGKVVDGHGDLHARNICLCEPPAIYDCVEFDRDLRLLDVAAENAFLVMDLRYRRHSELASAYLERYIAITGDGGQRELMPMLLRYRAMVRAKVAAIAAGEAELEPAEREGWRASAQRHLNLMAASAIEEGGACLICACGLPATGKTGVFEAVARQSGWPCFASDLIRKELAGIEPTERAPQSCYRREFSARTYDEMIRRAGTRAADGPVLLDANFGSAEQRGRAIECARRAGARIAFIWFRADARQIADRMQRRGADPTSASDADIAVYRQLEAAFEAPSAGEGALLIEAEAGDDLQRRVSATFRQLLQTLLRN